jgi:hypothetical protein
MNLNRRQFGKKSIAMLAGGAAARVLMVGGTAGVALDLSGCAALTDIEKVLDLITGPSITGIANSIISIIASIDPALGAPITLAVQAVEAGFATVDGIVKAYAANIAGMPQSVLANLDAAVSAISASIGTIESEIPNLSPIVAAGIKVGLLAFQAILGYLASIIPSQMAQTLFRRSFAALSGRGIQFGVTVMAIPTPHDFFEDYNHKMTAAGCKYARVHVPWKKWGPIPVAP